MYSENVSKTNSRILFRVIMVSAIIFAGVVIAIGFTSFRKSPPQMPIPEPTLQVEILDAKPENIPVSITGYGEVKALNVVSIAPEVSGKVVQNPFQAGAG